MNVVDWIASINPIDAVLVLYLFAWFILGYISGSVRRGIGILAITFSFLVAAQVQGPLGGFLAANWHQFPETYSYMVGFGSVFIAAVVALSIAVSAGYHKSILTPRFPVVDELLGGILGATQGYLLLVYVVIILDSHFLVSPGGLAGGLPFVHETWALLDSTSLVTETRAQVIPLLVYAFSFLLPASVKALYLR